jgi:chromosomal replication initiator protein
MTEIWNSAMDVLAQKLSAHNLGFFRKMRLHHTDGQTAYFEVTDDFVKAWIEDNWLDLVEEALCAVTDAPQWAAVLEVEGSYEAVEADQEIVLEASSSSVGLTSQSTVESAPPPRDDGFERRLAAAGLNGRYSFEEFVVGGSNQFVHAACSAVATTPSSIYNPLFVFGGVGLGKTHLLQAIGIEALRRDRSTRVVYLSSEEFMNQLITSIRNRNTNDFRARFRNGCDLLLIDDIQFIGGTDSTQEEFFHTFNSLYHAGKQIVITSDQPPGELPGIEERLASRFACGLMADIQPPQMETRIAILARKAELDGFELDREVAILIASCARNNVRELEGTLMRLGAQAKLLGQRITLEFAREALRRMNLDTRRQLTPQLIMKLVANHYDLQVSDLRGRSRAHAISRPRQLAMYLSRKHTDQSFPAIGRVFKKDHTSVIAACRKLEQLEDTDDPLAVALGEIEQILLH